MRTIFITIFQGVEARNILRTDIYKELANRPDVRLVLFTNSQFKKEYYQKEFFGSNVIYEVIQKYQVRGLNRIFDKLKFRLIYTGTTRLKRGRSFLNWLLARHWVRHLVRLLDWYLIRDQFFAPYFQKYKPSLVLMAHLFGGIEIALLREARHRKVVTVGLINSWDKITARCMIRLLPDWMIVHNNLIKADAIRYVDMPQSRVRVVGIPHFDFYVTQPRMPRDKFFQKWGLDPEKKIILFFPAGRTRSDFDRATITLLDDLLASGRLADNLQLLVRFPPNDDVEIKEGYKNKIVFQVPGYRFSMERGTDWDMDFQDFESLADAIFYSELVVTYSSTTVIDSAVFNKPIINLNFHPEDEWFYQVDHYQPILESGGVKVARNREELINRINSYLKNPLLDEEGRGRIIEDECWKLDGRSGKRVADFILSKI